MRGQRHPLPYTQPLLFAFQSQPISECASRMGQRQPSVPRPQQRRWSHGEARMNRKPKMTPSRKQTRRSGASEVFHAKQTANDVAYVAQRRMGSHTRNRCRTPAPITPMPITASTGRTSKTKEMESWQWARYGRNGKLPTHTVHNTFCASRVQLTHASHLRPPKEWRCQKEREKGKWAGIRPRPIAEHPRFSGSN